MLIPEGFSTDGGKKKILIVDDERAMVNLIKETLQVSGEYNIEVAFNGFSAGQKFGVFKPDLILLDIKMPKMDGFEVCSLIRKDPKNNDTKIIVLSGQIDEKDIKRLFELGANAYFSKPFNSEDLKEKVENLLGQNHPKKKNG